MAAATIANAFGQQIDSTKYAHELALESLLDMMASANDGQLPEESEIVSQLHAVFVSRKNTAVWGAHYSRVSALSGAAVMRMLDAGLVVPRIYEWTADRIERSAMKFAESVVCRAFAMAVGVNCARLVRAIANAANWGSTMSRGDFTALQFNATGWAAHATSVYRDDVAALQELDRIRGEWRMGDSTLVMRVVVDHRDPALFSRVLSPLASAYRCDNIRVFRHLLAGARIACDRDRAQEITSHRVLYSASLMHRDWLALYWTALAAGKCAFVSACIDDARFKRALTCHLSESYHTITTPPGDRDDYWAALTEHLQRLKGRGLRQRGSTIRQFLTYARTRALAVKPFIDAFNQAQGADSRASLLHAIELDSHTDELWPAEAPNAETFEAYVTSAVRYNSHRALAQLVERYASNFTLNTIYHTLSSVFRVPGDCFEILYSATLRLRPAAPDDAQLRSMLHAQSPAMRLLVARLVTEGGWPVADDAALLPLLVEPAIRTPLEAIAARARLSLVGTKRARDENDT